MAYILNSEVYKRTFKSVLLMGEITNGDEVLADMAEPQGNKISMLTGGHYSDTCKAFVATTSRGRVLIAVYDIFGKLYRCYCCDCIKTLNIKKVFGGSEIALVANSQYGDISAKMYVANRQFGTDLKQQREHKELLIKNLEKLKSDGEFIKYPVSNMLKNASKFTDFFGRTIYEPLGMQMAHYKGKDYLFFAQDKHTDTALIYTGDERSALEGFVYEGDVTTCNRVGRYDGTSQGLYISVHGKQLPKKAYCKEVPLKDIEYIYHRTFYAKYIGYEFELQDIMPDRVTLCLKVEAKNSENYDKVLREAGFEIKTEWAEHMWMKDIKTYTKREVPYNIPGLEFYVRKHYCAGDRPDEVKKFEILGNG